MKHTKEPWKVSSRRATFIINPNSAYTEVIAQCYFLDNKTEEENAKRIVACVNACARITNEELASNPIYDIKDPFVHDLQQKIKMLEVRIERLNRILTVNGISVQ